MSWGTITAEGPNDQIRPALLAALQVNIDLTKGAGQDVPTETLEQMAAALNAAVACATSGIVGKYVRVQLHGHSNPDHKPVPGWAADMIGINLWAVEPPVEEEISD